MTKIALVIGHNARSQGAVRVTDKRTEYDFNSDLAAAIRDLDPGRYVIIRRTVGANEIGRAYAGVNASGAVASVELHFNSTAATSATGTETLSSGSIGSMRLATAVQAGMVRALGQRDRGVKIIARDDRGGASLWSGRPPAVLLEPYFGSNASDCAAADRNFSALARAIHEACTAYLKGA